MKIIKKHAIAIAKVFLFAGREGYYPLTPEEGELIGKVLGFCVHHKMMDPEELETFRGYHDVKLEKVARLDLTRWEAECIMEVHDEVLGDPNLEDNEWPDFPKTAAYLNKTFPKGEPE